MEGTEYNQISLDLDMWRDAVDTSVSCSIGRIAKVLNSDDENTHYMAAHVDTRMSAPYSSACLNDDILEVGDYFIVANGLTCKLELCPPSIRYSEGFPRLGIGQSHPMMAESIAASVIEPGEEYRFFIPCRQPGIRLLLSTKELAKLDKHWEETRQPETKPDKQALDHEYFDQLARDIWPEQLVRITKVDSYSGIYECVDHTGNIIYQRAHKQARYQPNRGVYAVRTELGLLPLLTPRTAINVSAARYPIGYKESSVTNRSSMYICDLIDYGSEYCMFYVTLKDNSQNSKYKLAFPHNRWVKKLDRAYEKHIEGQTERTQTSVPELTPDQKAMGRAQQPETKPDKQAQVYEQSRFNDGSRSRAYRYYPSIVCPVCGEALAAYSSISAQYVCPCGCTCKEGDRACPTCNSIMYKDYNNTTGKWGHACMYCDVEGD